MNVNEDVVSPVEAQRAHWGSTFASNPRMYGDEASVPGQYAAELFATAGCHEVLELGSGQGRDTLALLDGGAHVHVVDYSSEALDQLTGQLGAAHAERLTTVAHDVRQTLPFPDRSFDAAYAHMLFCMALTTPELERLMGEVRRVLRPAGLLVYTVRNTDDVHFGSGIAHGDGMHENGGFIVHFFDRALVDRLAAGFALVDVSEFEEGDLPRRLWRVTQRSV